MEVTSLKKNWPPFSGSPPYKKYKTIRISLYQLPLKNFKRHLSWSFQHSILNIYGYYLFFAELQNINWLPTCKQMWSAYIKEKMFLVPVYIPFPYNVFFIYFLEGQINKDNKLGIVTNVGRRRLVKVIFTKHSQNKWCMYKQFW